MSGRQSLFSATSQCGVVDSGTQREHVNVIHWFSLVTLIVGPGVLFAGMPTAGSVVLTGAVVIELVYSAVTGKKTNDGAH